MPEMPEVQGLVAFLGERAVGRTITRAAVSAISALKTYDPPITALQEAAITASARRGKFIVLSCGEELHLAFHLAKAGWL
ncbi:MAG: DNA-formamidopyrimidine glycosylase family protein, partial [Microbacterium sp.]|uniref:DNA-formamidopyrimidine glycosylase family protein n=1 Tax=Microbacterium sp. TaxID=51671 RepID=UPI003BAF0D60